MRVLVLGALWASAAASLAVLDRALLHDLREAAPGARAYIFDIGANDGGWSNNWIRTWRAHRTDPLLQDKALEMHIFEPNPAFRASLDQLAASATDGATLNVTFHNVAAMKVESTIQFSVSSSSKRSTATEQSVVPKTRHVPVRGIDIAAFLLRTLPDASSLSLLKLDVEGLEYTLLPWMLAQGALCRVRYLIAEWHLNQQPLGQRLPALALRLSLASLLQHGCETPPRAVFNDEFMTNNAAVPVPGLQHAASSTSSSLDVQLHSFAPLVRFASPFGLRGRSACRCSTPSPRRSVNTCLSKDVASAHTRHLSPRTNIRSPSLGRPLAAERPLSQMWPGCASGGWAPQIGEKANRSPLPGHKAVQCPRVPTLPVG